MSSIRRPARSEAALGTLLTQATDAAQGAAREYAGLRHPPDIPAVRDESWQLIHLLGALSDLAAARAAQVGDWPQPHELHSDDGVEPARHVAHACRGWTDLRHALDTAQQGCREVYTALSHLNTRCLPGNGLSGGTGPIRPSR